MTPRGGSDGLDGIDLLADGRAVLKARVSAAPTDGEANEALIRLLAKTLRQQASRIRFESGETSRIKVLAVAGDPAMLMAALEQALTKAR